MSRIPLATAAAVVAALLSGVGPAGGQRPGVRPVRPAATAIQQVKGIWEPVNYSEDLELTSVYFVTADEGWVAGGGSAGHGVLLHTKDGGKSWEVALGDPEGNQRGFRDLQFVDQTTGFAVQGTGIGDHSLLRTIDGQHWSVVGTVPQHRADYQFLSATVGVAASGSEIRRTTDAGRTWTKVFDCALKVQVQGLMRAIRCEAAAFAFPTATEGYALGNSPDARGLYLLHTGDAGLSWTVWLAVPDVDGREGHVFFTDAQNGYVCTSDGRLFGTADGGKTISGLAGAGCPGKAPLRFADAEVGWTLRYNNLAYTTDGGQRWVSRVLAFPAGVKDFSLPRRDRAYAVGDHGMVYRYRVVPVDATVAAASVAAPAMPGLPTALAADVAQFDGQLGALDSGLQAFVDPGSGSAGSPSAGGFTQDALSPFMTSCCAKRASSLQLILTAITSIVPEFTGKYRNLNLLTQGLRTAAALPEAAVNLKAALQAFRTSGDKSAALSALATVKSLLATLRATTDTALQQPTFIQ